MAPGGVEPPRADAKFLQNACSEAYSVFSNALRFSQFCPISAFRDTVEDTVSRLAGQQIRSSRSWIGDKDVVDSAGADLRVLRQGAPGRFSLSAPSAPHRLRRHPLHGSS